MDLTPPYGDLDPSRLAELAREQHGVVATRQLSALGYSRRMIEHRVGAAELHRIHKGVYAVGHTRLSMKGLFMAAVLACGPRALLSHHAAASLHDLRRYPTGKIDVTAVGKRAHAGVRCHGCRNLHRDDRTIIDAIPVTSLPRTLLDLAEVCDPQRLRSLIEEADRRQILDAAAIERLVARSPGRHGLKPLTAAIQDAAPDAPWLASDLERAFRELLRAHDLPLPQTNVLVEGMLVDCVWPKHRLIAELDGAPYHRTRQAFETDRRRDMKLMAAGWRVIRITGHRIRHDALALVAELRALLSDG
jgi:very-short-patch-repair endonuclease